MSRQPGTTEAPLLMSDIGELRLATEKGKKNVHIFFLLLFGCMNKFMFTITKYCYMD